MSDVDQNRLFDRAVDLVINQDKNIHSWAGRYIAIQSGFAAAVAAIIGWKGSNGARAVTVLLVLLAILAVLFAHVMAALLRRELEWQGGYVESVKLIERTAPLLYREKMVPQRKGMEKYFTVAAWALTLSWIAFAVIMICLTRACN